MHKRLTADELQAALGSFADMILKARPRNHDPRPFAKREEGRARRLERRQAIARKSSWLNS